MASALQKLLRRPPPSTARIISALHPSQSPNPIDALHRVCYPPTAPLAAPATTEQSHSTIVFPSFPFGPFGFASKPIFETGFCTPEPEPEGEDVGLEEDSRTVWADSVKKKRKRKMNKHKYQKLRKRMRRQS